MAHDRNGNIRVTTRQARKGQLRFDALDTYMFLIAEPCRKVEEI